METASWVIYAVGVLIAFAGSADLTLRDVDKGITFELWEIELILVGSILWPVVMAFVYYFVIVNIIVYGIGRIQRTRFRI